MCAKTPRPANGPDDPKQVVNVTRFRVRAWRFVPLFMFHAQRAIAQLRRSGGYLAGAVRSDRDLAFWTITLWRDEQAMMAYVTSGAHRVAMPRLAAWGSEASTINWTQAGRDLPEWVEAEQRMRSHGRPLELRSPDPGHADVAYAPSHLRLTTRL